MKRTAEREQFLSDVLITAIEHMGYGFPGIVEYEPAIDGNPADAYAVIYDRYEDDLPDRTWRIDIDTMAKGLGIVRKLPNDGPVAQWVKDVIAADRTNGDDGDIDVIGALLVLECAIFGAPTYA
jgi:hypothetical protein